MREYVAIASVILAVYILAMYNKPKPVDWTESFSRKDKIPFGTFVLYERLGDIFPGSKIIARRDGAYSIFTDSDSETKPSNYIVIASSAKIGEYDFKKMVEYMRRGDNVFIASYYLGGVLEDSLKLKINSDMNLYNKKKSSLRFVNRTLNPGKSYVFDKGIGQQYFSKFDTSRAVILGVNHKGKPNFIKYLFGKGALYVMPSPFYFTNYNMLKPDGAQYASKALSYLPVKEEIIWDEYSTLGSEGESNMMRVFFKHAELKWAYYIALFSLLVFVVYEMKRRQRIIPIVAPLKNTSIEFAEVVGQVYYQQRNNSNIANKQVSYLLEGIRSKYNLKTGSLDNDFAEKLASKSGVKIEIISALIGQINQLRKYSSVSDTELIELNKNIEQFHQQSR